MSQHVKFSTPWFVDLVYKAFFINKFKLRTLIMQHKSNLNDYVVRQSRFPFFRFDKFVKFDEFEEKVPAPTKRLDGSRISLLPTYDYYW